MLFGGKINDRKPFYSFNPASQQWIKLPDLPSRRESHGSVVVGISVFLVGGWYNNTIEEYDISTKTFKNVATMKNYRHSFGICVFNKTEVLVAGGRGDYNMVINSCLLFNTNTKTFKEVGNMNTKRCGHVLVNVDETIYSIGGLDDNDEELNTIEMFDPVTEQWKTSDVKLHIERKNHQAVAHKHFIYIFGGWCGCRYTNTIERFNIKTGQVTIIDSKLHVARSDFAVGKVDSEVYIFGGEPSDHDYHQYLSLCEIFNLETEEIRKGETNPVSDCDFTACVV